MTELIQTRAPFWRNDRNDRINAKSWPLALAELGEIGEMTEMTELIQSRTPLALTDVCLNFNRRQIISIE